MTRTRRAVPELLLIVVGVFVALAAERWVAGGSDRALVEGYVRDLVSDLAQDSLGNVNRILMAEQRLAALDALLADLNGVGSALEDERELVALRDAQLVPTVAVQLATYQDLLGTGNLRLLEPALRRSLIEYHAAIAVVEGVIERNGGEKPEYSDLVPGRARQRLSRPCPFGPTTAGCLRAASEVIAQLSGPELASISSWRDLPQIRIQLERSTNLTLRFLSTMERVRVTRLAAMAAVRAAGH